MILQMFVIYICIFYKVLENKHPGCNCDNPEGTKIITHFRLGLCHLREYKFKQSLKDSINPLFNYDHDIKSTTHFLLHCPLYINKRTTLLSTFNDLNCNFLHNTDSLLTQKLLSGNTSFTSNKNIELLTAIIDYMIIFYQPRGLPKH